MPASVFPTDTTRGGQYIQTVSSPSLAQAFAEAAGVAVEPGSPVTAAELEADLRGLVDGAHAAWPKIVLTDADFIAHLAEHAERSGDPIAFVRTVHGTDLFLACAVARRDPAALAYFEDHFMAKVPDYVLRVRVGRDVVEEVQQQLRERLVMGPNGLPKIAEYSGKGALGGWLRIAAVRTALNRARDAGAKKEVSEPVTEALSVGGDPELAYVKEHAKELLSDAFRRVVAGLEAEERAMLRQHYIDGLTMDQLSTLYKTPRSTIARRVARVRQEILDATVARLERDAKLSQSAVASVIREAKSQIHITISRLLK